MTGTPLAQHAPTTAVAFGANGEPRSAAALLADAASIAATLPPPRPGSEVLLVFRGDRYAFTAALLATWSAGHIAALPPNTRRETVWALLDRPDTVALLHDTDSGNPTAVPPLLADTDGAHAVSEEPLPPLALPDDVIAAVYTSGSTGEMSRWPKTADQLFGEVATLAAAFEPAPGTLTVATVPPGHLYGLLFSVLLPLATGGAFARDTPFHGPAVAARVRDGAARGPVSLVTVPAHIRSLTAAGDGAFTPCSRVYSSTAPLAQDDARAFFEAHGVVPTEIFGSSETGGVATRTGGAGWSPLPGVGVAAGPDGRLSVDSPFLAPGMPRPYVTSDVVDFAPDGTFSHVGRVDGVVKVAGIRVSLPSMERALCATGQVSDAAVVAVPTDDGRGQALFAAIVPTGAPLDAPAVRALLEDQFERASLPRRVVCVEALPREDNGKLQRARVLRLFGLDPSGAPVRWDLDVEPPAAEAADSDVEVWTRRAHVPETYGWFEGHFPGYPVLAGAVQLDQLLVPAVRDAFSTLGPLRRLDRVKFGGRIGPGATVDVELRRKRHEDPDADASVEFQFRVGGAVCTSGRATFERGSTR